jgi:hypothetical protein
MQTFRFLVIAILLSVCLPLARADDIPWGLNPSLNDELPSSSDPSMPLEQHDSAAELDDDGCWRRSIFRTLGMSGSAWT